MIVPVLSVAAAVDLLAGILAGLQQDWAKMSLLFVGFVLLILISVNFVLAGRIEGAFKCMEDRLPRCRTDVHARNDRAALRRVGVLLTFSAAAEIWVAVFCAFRGAWLVFAVFLTACVVSSIVCTGIGTWLKIRRHIQG